jgi:hypothetical protein
MSFPKSRSLIALTLFSLSSGAFAAPLPYVELTRQTVGDASDRVTREYAKQNPDFGPIEFEVESCEAAADFTVTCTEYFSTGRADDEIQAVFKIQNGQLGEILSIEFSPGC